MDATELGRWTRFAAKGGIGKCTALQDCVAEEPEDLMFMKNDEITVLMQLADQEDMYLGYCEGVVGRFRGLFVRFHGRLKKPVMTRRSSSNPSRSRPSSSQSAMTVAARDTASPSVLSRASPGSTRDSSPRMSYSYSNSSSTVTESSSISRLTPASSSMPASPLRSSDSLQSDSVRMRSTSYSSISTALDSAPLTPADFTHGDSVRIQMQDDGNSRSSVVSPVNIRKQTPVVEAPQEASVEFSVILPPPEENRDSVSFDTEGSSRISIAMSDGVAGIGLSLLQGFVGSGDDDASMISRRSSTTSQELDEPTNEAHPDSEESTVEGPVQVQQQHSASPQSMGLPLSEFQPPAPPYAHARDSDVISRSSTHMSVAGSEYSGSDWSDIYDNYRYSRFSIASKMSSLSQGPLRPIGPGSDIPPVPVEHQTPREPSASQGRVEFPHPQSTLSDNGKTSSRSAADDVAEKILKGRPSPLELVGGRASSPLLHASFGSLLSPSTPRSIESFVSPATLSPPGDSSLPTGASTVSNFRMQQEQSLLSPVIRPSRESFVRVSMSQRLSGQDIVIEDDEGDLPSPFPQNASSASTPPPTVSVSPESLEGHVKSLVNHGGPPPYASISLNASSPSAPLAPPSLSQIPASLLPQVRPRNQNGPPSDFASRRSLFLPHPNAPKPAETPAGPMYGRQPAPPAGPTYHRAGPPPGSAIQILGMALAGNGRYTTMYAQFDRDLANSTGPVPISFSLEPQANIPANRPGIVKPHSTSVRSPSPAQYNEGSMLLDRALTQSPQQATFNGEILRPDSASKVIPRQNFFPQAPTGRPRSQSFSGFGTSSGDALLSNAERPGEGGMPIHAASVPVMTKRSKSASATPAAAMSHVALPSPQRAAMSHAASVARTVQKPSPLSQNSTVIPSSPMPSPLPMSPCSPRHGASAFLPEAFSAPGSPSSQKLSFDRASPSSPLQKEFYTGGGSLVRHQSKATLRSETSKSSPPSSPRSPTAPSGSHKVIRHSRSTVLSGPKATLGDYLTRPHVYSQGRTSVENNVRRPHDMQWNISSPSPVSDTPESGSFLRARPLRMGAPSTALRIPSSDSSLQLGDRSPSASVLSLDQPHDQKTVSVQDMDFELVRPTVPRSPLAGDSVNSLPPSVSNLKEDASSTPHVDGSATSFRQPPLEQCHLEQKSKAVDTANVEAHRQRELRWISAMTSTPASQSRKSKKIKKLVMEGVPASVRYLVWAHLTDSKTKRMDGLYTRLGLRERVASIAGIEQDARCIFSDQPLQNQSLVNILQAYLTMVPDVEYSRGLAVISGELLLHSPEEDAFWTFVSMMDSHLRPYFSRNPVQLEIDASLFSKALEVNDAALSKKIYIDMAIPPAAVCRPWFTSVFADTLSSECLRRVWDVFLFDGVVFLFRVGLAIISCCRHALLRCDSKESLLAILSSPPRACLPSSPDELIELAYSVRLKDEEILKQRSRLEAQVKRQTQTRILPTSGPRGLTPTISLPRS